MPRLRLGPYVDGHDSGFQMGMMAKRFRDLRALSEQCGASEANNLKESHGVKYSMLTRHRITK
jgi:hypothetical protein